MQKSNYFGMKSENICEIKERATQKIIGIKCTFHCLNKNALQSKC